MTIGRGAALLCAWLLACAAASAPQLSLGGIAIGSSVLDAVKRLGMPDNVQTNDIGQFWQWADRGGLDREVYTDDDLDVESVLIAPARAGSTSQPSEAPVLGMTVDNAKAMLSTAGAGPLVTKPAAKDTLVWPLDGGYLVAETDGTAVLRLRAVDVDVARRFGYAGDPLVVPPHTAPVLVRQLLPSWQPPGQGTVIVRVTIDATGKPVDERVIVPSGDSDVDRFELDSMKISLFRPATCAGVPCAGVYIDIGGLMR